ncbi:MAG: hypothetical protein NTZ64_00380 [Polaromonas sp.]|nr:hypothetical protein [Polaromonas sp.]
MRMLLPDTVGTGGDSHTRFPIGHILEIESLPDLKVEQAFELSDASAERSAGRRR